MTDDSIMTLAVANALMETEKALESVAKGQERNNEYYILLEKMSIQYMQALGAATPIAASAGRSSVDHQR